MSRRSLTALAVAVFLIGIAVWSASAALQARPAQALTLSQLQSLISQARTKQKGLSSTIARLDARLNIISDRLASLNSRIEKVTAILQEREAEYERLHAELIAKKRELKRAQELLLWQQMVFSQRVVDAYKVGDISYLDVLLDSRDYEDMLTRVRLLGSLLRNDNDLVAQLDDARHQVAVEKREVGTKTRQAREVRDEVRAKRDELGQLKSDQLATQADTRLARLAKKKALASVQKSLRAWEAQEAQLAAESQGLAGVINGLAGDGDGRATGSMVWPCAGYLSSGFGWRVHPIFHVRKFHTGIDIGAGYGIPIRAADGGRVIYATWMSGYGNTIIVDHGQGRSTLYAHQSRILIGSGPVSRGQVIGYVGSTGYSTGPHLHFEVRVNGNPVNPLGYLP